MYACQWTAVHVLRYATWARAGILPHPLAPPSDATHDATRNTPTTVTARRRGGAHALPAVVVRAAIALKLARLDETHGTLANTDELNAHRIIREHRDYLRLLDDLGWAVHDPRPDFPLTMPVEAVGRTLARLADQDPAVAAVCDALLERLP